MEKFGAWLSQEKLVYTKDNKELSLNSQLLEEGVDECHHKSLPKTNGDYESNLTNLNKAHVLGDHLHSCLQ